MYPREPDELLAHAVQAVIQGAERASCNPREPALELLPPSQEVLPARRGVMERDHIEHGLKKTKRTSGQGPPPIAHDSKARVHRLTWQME
jgi:hypothetical protein